jgi:hypothetical protein
MKRHLSSKNVITLGVIPGCLSLLIASSVAWAQPPDKEGRPKKDVDKPRPALRAEKMRAEKMQSTRARVAQDVQLARLEKKLDQLVAEVRKLQLQIQRHRRTAPGMNRGPGFSRAPMARHGMGRFGPHRGPGNWGPSAHFRGGRPAWAQRGGPPRWRDGDQQQPARKGPPKFKAPEQSSHDKPAAHARRGPGWGMGQGAGPRWRPPVDHQLADRRALMERMGRPGDRGPRDRRPQFNRPQRAPDGQPKMDADRPQPRRDGTDRVGPPRRGPWGYGPMAWKGPGSRADGPQVEDGERPNRGRRPAQAGRRGPGFGMGPAWGEFGQRGPRPKMEGPRSGDRPKGPPPRRDRAENDKPSEDG